MTTIAWLQTGQRFLRAAHIVMHLCMTHQHATTKRWETETATTKTQRNHMRAKAESARRQIAET